MWKGRDLAKLELVKKWPENPALSFVFREVRVYPRGRCVGHRDRARKTKSDQTWAGVPDLEVPVCCCWPFTTLDHFCPTKGQGLLMALQPPQQKEGSACLNSPNPLAHTSEGTHSPYPPHPQVTSGSASRGQARPRDLQSWVSPMGAPVQDGGDGPGEALRRPHSSCSSYPDS